jgi:hypothetical protein
MMRGDQVLTVPNPHRSGIGVDLLKRILERAGVSRDAGLATEESWLKMPSSTLTFESLAILDGISVDTASVDCAVKTWFAGCALMIGRDNDGNKP